MQESFSNLQSEYEVLLKKTRDEKTALQSSITALKQQTQTDKSAFMNERDRLEKNIYELKAEYVECVM